MLRRHRTHQRGASIVLLPIMLVVLLGVGAFAVDLNNVLVKQTELQNAADAGALEGARVLYCADGRINYADNLCAAGQPSANNAASAAASANLSQRVAVEVLNADRGHWEFRSSKTDATGIERGGVFTVNSTTTAADLLNSDGSFKSFQVVNNDPNEINAVRVITARQTTPIRSWFGRILGIDSYQGRASAVAYVGFAGKILPGEVDYPLAMCLDAVQDGCSVGRVIRDNADTGGWTDFVQPCASGEAGCTCGGAANANAVKDLVFGCGGDVNEEELFLGVEMNTNNGIGGTVPNVTYQCFTEESVKLEGETFAGKLNELDADGDGFPDRPWQWLLPVIDCSISKPNGCNPLVGAVLVDVLWMFDENSKKLDDSAPQAMTRVDSQGVQVSWNYLTAVDVINKDLKSNGLERWQSFVNFFNLKEPDGITPALPENKSIYYAPDCEPAGAFGGTGGANFGIRAAVPVLVF